ncbi:MAG: RNA 3'-terminal phosphate cyclase [Thiohalophilus sp.]
MRVIDGSTGEGGGQVLRSALALSVCLNLPFRIINIRIRRPRPGLQPQHLAAVNAAAAISIASLEGAELHSTRLEFSPRRITPGSYTFDIGTAGSTSLVLQTILPALILASSPSQLQITGGTHNPMAPTYEYLHYTFLPILRRMGADIRSELIRPGFYPRGGGQIAVSIHPVKRLEPLYLSQRGQIVHQYARILSSRLPRHVAEREWQIIHQQLHYPESQRELIFADNALSPGNAVNLILQTTHLNEVFTALGKPGLPAEQVAQSAVDDLRRYLDTPAPVDAHLADQLLLPIALAGEGGFRTTAMTSHTRTNMAIITRFTHNRFVARELAPDDWEIRLTS